MEPTDDPLEDPAIRRRVDVLTHLRDGTIDLDQASALLAVSTRQVRRLLGTWLASGAVGLVHGNRGRRPANRTDESLRATIVGLVGDRYAGVNRQHLSELLAEHEGITIEVRTLRRLLDGEGKRSPETHRAPRHRSRRTRRQRAGQLLQADGSTHRWFGPELPEATLVGAIDDATSVVTGATFREHEDAAGYLEVLAQTSRLHGLPWTFHTDRHGIFERDPREPPTIAEQLEGRRTPTQVGRALEVAGVGWIPAASPEAKGRVERLWGTLQDRMVVELRLAGIADITEANAFLPGYLARHNARFGVPPADPTPAWRPWPDGLSAEAVFAFWYERTVGRDNTVAWGGGALALPRRSDGRTRAGQRVRIAERLDGSLWAELEGIWRPLVPAPPSVGQLRARPITRAGTMPISPREDIPAEERRPAREPNGPWRPAADHPWRREGRRR
jgi:hypothetical protein